MLRQFLILSLLLICFVSVKADWKKVNLNTFAWLHSVYFVNEQKGWIVGSQGTFLATVDGGATWKLNKKITTDTILDVYFSDEKRGWMLCERGVFGSTSVSPSYILETFDGGENWEPATLQGDGNERLVKLFFSKDGFGKAVGEQGTFYSMQEDGKTWKKTNLTTRFLLIAGNFFNLKNGIVVGGGGTAMLTEDGGNSWNMASFTAKPTSKLNSIFFINQKIGWAVGAGGKIYTTINSGKFWREQNSTVKRDLFDVFFTNTAEGWAIGEGGTMLQTNTAGNVWKQAQTPVKHRLERIFFAGKTGWAIGFGGTVLKFESGIPETKITKPIPTLQKRNYSAWQ